ncbi:MAG: hypothetical protein FWG53_03150, partial [Clostridiales bacterium]|nr:hypothetical protein [Clostridiales bacterium]
LFNEMFPAGGRAAGRAAESPAEKTVGGLVQLMDGVKNIVIVSDYIYSDAIVYGKSTVEYMKSLASIDCALAKRSDIVIEAAYSNLAAHKGRELLGELYEKMR